MQILKEKTRSICNVCYEEIPARVFSEDGSVFLEKTCPVHGYFKGIAEQDVEFYKRFYHSVSDGPIYFHCLTIPITYRCDMYCKFCYTHNCTQEDYDLVSLEKTINNFSGYEIALSGGEPTLRDDLTEIIKVVKRAQKRCVLITHGLKLADRKYVAKLKQAGLDRIFFSLDSFKSITYDIFKAKMGEGKRVLELKLQALKNIEAEKILTQLSSTIYPGVNEDEIKDLLLFCLKNNHFIFDFRVRSCAEVGRFTHEKTILLSELLKRFSAALGVNRETLVSKCLKKKEYCTIHHIQLSIRGLVLGKKFLPFVSDENSKFDKFRKLIFILGVLLKAKPNEVLEVVTNIRKPRFTYLTVRLVRWPTKENFDLQENDRGIAHLYDGDKIAQFCHAIIMLNKPQEAQEALTQ